MEECFKSGMGWYVIIQCSYEKQFSCVCIDFFKKIDANFLSHKKHAKNNSHENFTISMQIPCEHICMIFAWETFRINFA